MPTTGVFSIVILIAGAVLVGGGPTLGASGTADCPSDDLLTDRLACYLDTAMASDDPGVCLDASEEAVVFNCIANYAENTGDPAACARIPDDLDLDVDILRETCVIGVAVRKGNVRVCADVDTRELRDSCYFMMVTEGDVDPDVCARITSEALQAACRE